MLRVKVVPQKQDMDCGVACLAMLLDLSYEDVYVEVAKVDRWRSKRGLYITQIKKVASALGKELSYKRKYDLEDVVGILSVDFKDSSHVVILYYGVIVETDGTVWLHDDYLLVNEAKPCSLLVLKD